MVFCLDDGAKLVDQDARDESATLNLPTSPTIAAAISSPKSLPTSPNPLRTITAKPEHFQMPPAYTPAQAAPRESSRSPLPWIFAIVLVLGLSGVLIAFLATRGSDDQANNKDPQPTPVMSPSREATPEATVSPSPEQEATPTPDKKDDLSTPPPRPTEMPTRERPKPAFSVLNNMTFNGSRITYYPRASFGACQADCSANANCRGFTWIRPGAYNPGDAAMCYLMASVGTRVPHACCISGIRN